MKYVGTIQSIPTSENDSYTQIIDGVKIDRELIGKSSVWLNGYIVNGSTIRSIYVNFYNSAREVQRTEIPARHTLRVKNQNCDRLQLDPDITGFANYKYYLSVLESESDQESKDMLVYSQLQLEPMSGYDDLVQKNTTFIISDGVIDLVPIIENHKIIILDIWGNIARSTLPVALLNNNAEMNILLSILNNGGGVVDVLPAMVMSNYVTYGALEKINQSVDDIGVAAGLGGLSVSFQSDVIPSPIAIINVRYAII